MVTTTSSRDEALALYGRSPERWMLILDERQRPLRWVNELHLRDTSQPLGQAGPLVRAKVLPNATLHDALEELLLSNAGQAVVVNERDEYLGILDVERLADVLKRMRADARKHYETRAALMGAPTPPPVDADVAAR